jgi:hypothetical protein
MAGPIQPPLDGSEPETPMQGIAKPYRVAVQQQPDRLSGRVVKPLRCIQWLFDPPDRALVLQR